MVFISRVSVGHLLVLFGGSLIVGCASTARLYNLETGEVLTAQYQNYGTGHGKITLTTPAGITLVGEYTTISGASYSSSTASANAVGSGGYAWATAQGFSFNQPGQQYGSATAAGDGLVIDIVYVVDPWSGHGHGVGQDNKGGKYRLQF
jgi:hypothetical protein